MKTKAVRTIAIPAYTVIPILKLTFRKKTTSAISMKGSRKERIRISKKTSIGLLARATKNSTLLESRSYSGWATLRLNKAAMPTDSQTTLGVLILTLEKQSSSESGQG